jgi:transcriptional regulator with XRE-family HTH domain
MISVLGEVEAMRTLGARVRQERLRRNLSQSYLARTLGVTVPTYRKIESGDGSVEFRHVAKALGVLGYVDALGNLIPEVQPELRLRDLLAPERKRASARKRP